MGDEVQGKGSWITIDDIDFTTIPLHVRAGTVLPLRLNGANTTTELRKRNFELLIAPASNNTATGQLYFDDGNSIVQEATSFITFTYVNGTISTSGSFGYNPGVSVVLLTILGVSGQAKTQTLGADVLKRGFDG